MKLSAQPSFVIRAQEREGAGATRGFRRASWLEFQRALDPLGRPRPLPATTRR